VVVVVAGACLLCVRVVGTRALACAIDGGHGFWWGLCVCVCVYVCVCRHVNRMWKDIHNRSKQATDNGHTLFFFFNKSSG
jgi:hypothetical protein